MKGSSEDELRGADILRSSNPLIEPLGAYVESAAWPSRLAHDPLEGLATCDLSEESQDLLLSFIRRRLEPTRQAIQIAQAVQRMWRHSYAYRNPTVTASRRQVVMRLALRGKSLDTAPWLPTFANALIVESCTGMGKSTIVERVCSLVPQRYKHGASEAAGWQRHVQVTYLIVPMPVHRGGLLYAILAALDGVLGTEYRTQYAAPRIWTIEKLAIEVGILLTQHSVGLLVIEELQPRNFSQSPYRDEMLLMLLRLLNFGIPIVFVGNPLAFEGLADHSQDIRRLTAAEGIHLMPLGRDDDDWSEGLAPGLWSHNVMAVKTPFTPGVERALHACSAGIPDFLWKAVEGAQRIAVQLGDKCVNEEHIWRYRDESLSFKRCKDLIEGFEQKDPIKLARYVDVPWETYGLMWGKIDPLDFPACDLGKESLSSTGGPDAESVRAYHSVHERLRRKYSSAVTAKKTRTKANASVRASAKPEDLRSGATDLLVSSLSSLRGKGSKQS